MLRSGMIG